MCGRFTLTVDKELIMQYLDENYSISDIDKNIILPRYNIAPGQQVVSMISDGTRYRIGTFKWGFVPSFAKDIKIGFKMINARSETIAEKRSYQSSLVHKRCIIFADGFYEWKQTPIDKFPMRIVLKNKKIFAFAGLWSTYIDENKKKHHTCTILTTKANSMMELIHDRMPVILDEDKTKIWLDPKIKDVNVLKNMLQQYDPNKMEAYRVSKLVNKPQNDTMELIKKVESIDGLV